ncbi:hypothetical protein CDV31_005934 [Fusarium ambrosium]|uniref:DUF4470 domain-containing protein n=1 Tax=Fusarium ambrosium TaxID=131363 RepID=A0A428UG16_9HYPO|nr:hypothetical protein CDV31_005934 [Fusarium ambrosium]
MDHIAGFRREPTFSREGYVEPFATHKNLWGDVPALDILKLDENEGVAWNEDLAILFGGKYRSDPLPSGDLRNVIKTVTSLPESFRKRIAITINDNDFEVVARNIILLLTAMFSVEPEDGANRMIHIWYSAFIERSHLQFLHSVVRPKIQKVCSKLENKAPNHLHSETFDDGFYSQVSIVLPKKSWVALLGYLEVPEGLSFYQAREVRKAATLPSGHLDYHRFRLDGIMLPFGASRKPFGTPNPTLFHAPRWPYKGDFQPIHGWDLGEVTKVSSGIASLDHYGKLFYYLHELFAKFCRELRSRSISFRLYNEGIHYLAGNLEARFFARIELSNFSERPHINPGLLLRCLIHLLQGRTTNRHATLIMLFTTSVWAQLNNLRGSSMAQWAPTIMSLIPRVVMPPDNQDPKVSKVLVAMGLITDVDDLFEQVLNANQGYHHASMAVKRDHTIVKKWPWRPNLIPGQYGTLEELAIMLSTVNLSLARYVEYKSLLF